jgi:twitching motility protein PilI
MVERISLREFQQALSLRFSKASAGDRRTLLAFGAGGQRWMLPVAQAGEIMPVPPLSSVPLTHPWFRGLVNVRGTLFSVTDWAAFHGEAWTHPGSRARLLLIGMRFGVHCALLVSATFGLRNPSDFECLPPPENSPAWNTNCLRSPEGEAWSLLDVPCLLADLRFLDIGLR